MKGILNFRIKHEQGFYLFQGNQIPGFSKIAFVLLLLI